MHGLDAVGGLLINQGMCRCLISLLFVSCLFSFVLQGEDKPNFLLILTDDLGYGDTSVYGAPDLTTPNIDRLAKEGMLFTSMRANCTVCSPTRAAMLTGKYADRVGVPGVIRTGTNTWGYFDPSASTLADELNKAGYHTAIVGKWHLGLKSPNTPNERGFDFFHGFLGDMMDDYYTHRRSGNNYMRLNSEIIEPEGHATELFTDWAIEYLHDRASQPDEPFFLYLAYNAPHFPIQPPDDWLARVEARAPELSKKRAKNVAFVEHTDDCIGRLLEGLKAAGLAENTVVVFTSDNGGALGYDQRNLPWRSGKQSHYDGGLKVPFLVRWPGQVAAGSISDYEGLTFDVFPMFLNLAGAQIPEDLDAEDISPLFAGESMPKDRSLYFVRREGRIYGGKSYNALIRNGWKLMQNNPYSQLELYNLKEDPQETTNLFKKEQKLARELQLEIQDHIQRAGSVPWEPPAK
ncbi:MAG: sulfatase-like hydrolase/transferase [Verrucomicrobiota bacterium]